MPLLLNRRAFLASALASAAAGALAQETSRGVRWALLSDTHIPADPADTYRGFKPAENFITAVKQVTQESFDCHLVNGDLARLSGQPADYQRFAATAGPLSERTPLALLLGNHDDRANAVAAFPKPAGEREPVENKWVSVVESGGLRVILLDSLYETNKTPGLLGKPQRDWLAADLDAHAGRPTLIFVHHTLTDADSALLDSDRFLNILRPRRQVKAVFYGHSHEWRHDVDAGIHLVNIPAVGYNFADSEPVGWVDARFTPARADVTLHAFAGNRAKDGETLKLDWR
jgi:3',5'-cyclic AMP phosphodiesterase CpdA